MSQELIKGLDLCDNCETQIDEDQYHIVNDEVNWCCECYHQKYAFCDNCGEDYEHKDMIVIKSKDPLLDFNQYCKWCYEQLKKNGEL